MITSFTGQYYFLSNFYYWPIVYNGLVYKTNEHAYQAQKTLDIYYRELIRTCDKPGRAKYLGRNIILRPDWEEIKVIIMKKLLELKFTTNNKMGEMLLNTIPEELIEGNYWNDTFWGICNNKGLNHLGKLLMQRRNELVPF